MRNLNVKYQRLGHVKVGEASKAGRVCRLAKLVKGAGRVGGRLMQEKRAFEPIIFRTGAIRNVRVVACRGGGRAIGASWRGAERAAASAEVCVSGSCAGWSGLSEKSVWSDRKELNAYG